MISKKIFDKIEEFARIRFSESWDNCGLQIGSNSKEVKKILLALDMSKKVCEKAVRENFDLIITHHPFFFSGFKKIVLDGYQGNIIENLIKNNISLYSAHTNLDITYGGVNDVLCDILNIKNTNPLSISYEEKLIKLVVYIPKGEYADLLRKELGEKNYGKIGNYSNCSFSTLGNGRFKPEKNSNAFIGKEGKIEIVEEEKIEFLMYENELEDAIKIIEKVHPYEEVAYDVYILKNKGKIFGHGRIGNLPQKVKLEDFCKQLKNKLKCDYLRVYGNLNKEINRVALCGGSGACFITDAKKQKADVYITGDIKHHDAQKARELGICIIDAGHYNLEIHVLKALKEYLELNFGDIEIKIIEDNISRYNLI